MWKRPRSPQGSNGNNSQLVISHPIRTAISIEKTVSQHQKLIVALHLKKLHPLQGHSKRFLDYNKLFCTQFMKKGLAQEPVIINEYFDQMNVEWKSVIVDKCGFFAFVSESHPFLGARPDGLVSFQGDERLLEMKFIQRSATESLEEALVKKRVCSKRNEGNKNHAYFYQIQHVSHRNKVDRLCCQRVFLRSSVCEESIFLMRDFGRKS